MGGRSEGREWGRDHMIMEAIRFYWCNFRHVTGKHDNIVYVDGWMRCRECGVKWWEVLG